jgi:hypothetical protein
MGHFPSGFILLQHSLTGSVSLDDRVDSSSCAPAAAGFMMVVGGSDCEVLVDASDIRCKLLFARERWIDCSYWKEREVFGEKGSENKRLAWCKINKSIDNERQDVERPTHDV